MGRGPRGERVDCPECGNSTIAIIPPDGSVVEDEETADGKVWVNCWDCGAQFLAHYRKDR